MPFLSVVVIITILAAFATLPLGQLCFFHALLIQKGISTFDYIIAMRERDQHITGDSFPSPYASPASSVATAMSGASSTGALHHAAWCTPPRLLVDHEQNPIKVDEVKRISLEALRRPVQGKTGKKPPAKISPWALARLNAEDALRAAADARKNSSVFRPVLRKEAAVVVIAETDSSCERSSGEVIGSTTLASSQQIQNEERLSPVISVHQVMTRPQCGGIAKVPVMLGGNASGFIERVGSGAEPGTALMPLQLEARYAFCGRSGSVVSQSPSSSLATSTESSEGSPEVHVITRRDSPPACGARVLPSRTSQNPVQARRLSHAMGLGIQFHPLQNNEQEDRIVTAAMGPSSSSHFELSTSDGYEASGGESGEDDSDHNQYQGFHRESGLPIAGSSKTALERLTSLQRVVENVPPFVRSRPPFS